MPDSSGQDWLYEAQRHRTTSTRCPNWLPPATLCCDAGLGGTVETGSAKALPRLAHRRTSTCRRLSPIQPITVGSRHSLSPGGLTFGVGLRREAGAGFRPRLGYPLGRL